MRDAREVGLEARDDPAEVCCVVIVFRWNASVVVTDAYRVAVKESERHDVEAC